MPVSALDHFTIRCSEADLEPLREFYTRVVGLHVGDRPPIPAPGFWLYGGGRPIVHLYAIGRSGAVAGGKAVTGPLDHISFRSKGLDETRSHLRAHAVAFDEAPVPGWPLHQIFLHDPTGLKIELTFDLDAEREHANA
jgi:catechol 2,3-dioxygenase-like lactoylglutathione lyase family enzyme